MQTLFSTSPLLATAAAGSVGRRVKDMKGDYCGRTCVKRVGMFEVYGFVISFLSELNDS